MTPERAAEILNLKIVVDDPAHGNEGMTIGSFFAHAAAQLWSEGSGFSGKRPFGDSGWEWAIHRTLAKYLVAPAELTEALKMMEAPSAWQ